MFKKTWVKILIISLIIAGSTVVWAAEYKLLEPEVIGKSGQGATTNFLEYANLAYKTLLTAAVILSILMIVIGGFQYLTSAIPLVKSNGIGKVTDALIGLAIALLSYLILYVINPDLVNWKLNIKQLGNTSSQTTK